MNALTPIFHFIYNLDPKEIKQPILNAPNLFLKIPLFCENTHNYLNAPNLFFKKSLYSVLELIIKEK